MRIMPRLASKLAPVFAPMLAARREPAMISLAEVIVVINVSVEVLWPVIPGSRTDKYSAVCKPFRTIVAIGGTVVRCHFVVPVRTNGRRSDSYRNLRGRMLG